MHSADREVGSDTGSCTLSTLLDANIFMQVEKEIPIPNGIKQA